MPILGIMASAISGNLVTLPSGAYDSIATTTVGATSVPSITFSSIPATYTHLQIRYLVKSARAGNTLDELNLRMNGDTGSNYAEHQVMGDGSTAQSQGVGSQNNIEIGEGWCGTTTAGSQFGVGVIDILDYVSTSKYKTIRALGGLDMNGSGRVGLGSGLWMNTSAVTSLTFFAENANITQYSSFALYGIKGA